MAGEHPVRESITAKNQELFELAEEARGLYLTSLREFNQKGFRLAQVPAHKRIFLFFITRMIKTFSAVVVLCREGYAQDAVPLLRTLLEILISVRYILRSPKEADQKAVRFVDYKWVMLKRQLAEAEGEGAGEASAEVLNQRRKINEQFEEFKKKYAITSDKALVTWSGKSTRDMARRAGKDLLNEYESAFRVDSQFSHPSIIGDRDYLDFRDNVLSFSFQPGDDGIVPGLKRAIHYLVCFFVLFDSLYELGGAARLAGFAERAATVFQMEKYRSPLFPEKNAPSRERDDAAVIHVRFDLSSKS